MQDFYEEGDGAVIDDGLAVALDWARQHPGRDALDAATAAVMLDKHPTAHGLGQHLWPEFLAAVKAALA